ncbi:YajD family HNH nuclease [Methylocaldum szegediense]|uniref:Putative HNH nuclease YajD n=1 Tax=Methylocaldum szegediense TaxID=73780 RepID=A0ABM9HWP8_9GAMM|nr:YajD family HNH nuclease [Methylocaldum szegediense]CAI8737509.1 HNH nuclease family protein YajD [Methylocaldum szegediense]
MSAMKTGPDHKRLDQVVAEARRRREERERGYREQALKLYPWVCGRCGREFSRSNLSELTVHHKDHNHDNNPPDGSNWELLCIYCHDDEHARHLAAGRSEEGARRNIGTTFKPFAELDVLLRKQDQ